MIHRAGDSPLLTSHLHLSHPPLLPRYHERVRTSSLPRGQSLQSWREFGVTTRNLRPGCEWLNTILNHRKWMQSISSRGIYEPHEKWCCYCSINLITITLIRKGTDGLIGKKSHWDATELPTHFPTSRIWRIMTLRRTRSEQDIVLIKAELESPSKELDWDNSLYSSGLQCCLNCTFGY